MPAQPLTKDQLADAARLRKLFVQWQSAQRRMGEAASQEYAASQLGFNQSALSQYIGGRIPLNLSAALKFAALLAADVRDFSPTFADAVSDGGAQSGAASDADFAEIRRVDVKFSNGPGQIVDFIEDDSPLMFRKDFLRAIRIKPENAVVVRASGVSNSPRIADGAVVLVNRADRERLDGGFFAFREDGELLIKHLERIDGVGVLATADNVHYKPRTRVYTKDIDFEVIGRAVWVGATL